MDSFTRGALTSVALGILARKRFLLSSENFPPLSALSEVDPLLRSHHELRALVRLLIRELARTHFGRKNWPLLDKARAVLAEAKLVAEEFEWRQ